MISIIFAREILKAVTDLNINSSASKIRVNSFHNATFLKAQCNQDVQMVLEGNLFKLVGPRLEEVHMRPLESLFKIDDSGVDVPNYNITKSIKFIAEREIKQSNKRVIIITDNVQDYQDIAINCQVRIFTPSEFIKRVNHFKKIKNNFNDDESALIAVFFL